MIKAKKRQEAAIPFFVNKLYKILEDQEMEKYISWTKFQNSFMIKDISLFTDMVMPKYFKHRNFCSLIRQLNMYGFRKTNKSQGDNIYYHPFFQKDDKNLLSKIHRKQSEKKDKKREMYQKNDQPVQIQENNGLVQHATKISKLEEKHKNLQEMCTQMVHENEKLLKQNQEALDEMESLKKEKNHKMEQALIYLIMVQGNNQLYLPSSWSNKFEELKNSSLNSAQHKTGSQGYNQNYLNILKQTFCKKDDSNMINLKNLRKDFGVGCIEEQISEQIDLDNDSDEQPFIENEDE